MQAINTHHFNKIQEPNLNIISFADTTIMSSSDHRPTVVLCSSKDDFLLSQDICTLCGSLGKKDEGNLICCSQCGQCYHPFCVNIKGIKVVVTKGWRCLECTVCETCGQPGDEAKLMLCDECELSFHTYCLDPPLEDVPQGAWKCHWCVVCQRCGTHSPGTGSRWQKNYTECGPCSSLSTCPNCKIDYTESDLIIQCVDCSRWLHARCDSIRDEEECELASELGYSCLLCRPKGVIPLYIVHRKSNDSITQNNIDDERVSSCQQRTKDDSQTDLVDHDNVGLQKSLSTAFDSDSELNAKSTPILTLIKHKESDFNRPRSAPLTSSQDSNTLDSIKRPSSSMHFSAQDPRSLSLEVVSKDDLATFRDIDADENNDSFMFGRRDDDMLQGSHLSDGIYLSDIGFNYMKSQKLEPIKRQRAKRGTKLQKLDDSNQEDMNRDDEEENKFTEEKIDDDGRKRRIRKLSKVGIGGFSVRQRGVRVNKEDDSTHNLRINSDTPLINPALLSSNRDQISENMSATSVPLKPKRIRRKPKKKTNLMDQYPSYLQEAFFGKDLLSCPEPLGIDENHPETSNDCSTLDLQSTDGLQPSSLANESCRVEIKMRSNSRSQDLSNEFSNDAIDKMKISDSRQFTKDDKLMDVFTDDSQVADERKVDAFDPDLLNTDFNLEMDSKVVEDLLNGLGPQTGDQKPNQISQLTESYEHLAPQGNIAPTNANNYPTPTTIHPHANHSSPVIPQQSSMQHGPLQQQRQTQSPMISSNVSPLQMVHAHPSHQISPTIQHTPCHQIVTPSNQVSYDIGEVHQPNISHITQHSHNNSDSNNPIMINPAAPIQSPSITLSPRAKMSSPCVPNSHRPPSNASSIGPMSSPAQQMHHPSHPPTHQNHLGASPMIESEANTSQYHMPQSPWTNPQQDPSRQFSPLISNEPNWQSQSSQDLDGQGKKAACQNWEFEEALGGKATKSAVLYANLEHPELKQQYTASEERYKQIQKLWRQLPAEKRKPFVDKARENRSASKITNKPSETLSMSKKPPQGAIGPMKHHEGMHMLPQHQHQVSPMPIQQVQVNPGPQDSRWKQPMPIDNVHQQSRFMHSPQTHRPVPHDPSMMGQPPQAMSPSMRPLQEPGPHYERQPIQPMINPSSSSPHAQFTRPQMQQNMHVARVRPPMLDSQRPDPYAVPPSTPRPMPMQQRSPFSPQSPFPPHQPNVAPSTPPIAARTPNDHPVIYQQSSHLPMQPAQGPQQNFIDNQHPPHTPGSGQFQARQPHYSGHQRLGSPMNQPQYNNQAPNQAPMMRGPMQGPIRPQIQQQQPQFQQQAQYRHPQTVRYPNQHQEMHPHVSSPVQHNQPSQQQVQRRIQSPIANRQMSQPNMQQSQPSPRIINQPRAQHPMGQPPIQHITMQQAQPQQPIQQIQPTIQTQGQQSMHHPGQLSSESQAQSMNQVIYTPIQANRMDSDDPTQLLEDEDDLKDLGADFNILEYADPEPDNATSTSTGKNAIEIDPELEEYFDERDTLDDKRSGEQMVAMGPQQVLQHHQTPQQQHVHVQHQQPSHNQPVFTQGPMPHHNRFIQDQNQPNMNLAQNPNMMQQQQCTAQRQPSFVGQIRGPHPNHQQYSPNQQQQQQIMRRSNQACPPVRMQNPQQQVHQQQPQQQQQQQQQMVNYQSHRPQNPRYIQNQVTHDNHMPQPSQSMQQPMMGQQRVNVQPVQRGPMVQQPQQYHHQGNFIENHQGQQHQIPAGHIHQQQYTQQSQHVPQHQQQQHIMYNSNQMGVPRQYIASQQQQQPAQQPQQHHYSYQQQQQQQQQQQHHQGGYSQMSVNQQSGHAMKQTNDMMIHEVPIVSDAVTSMEFTMYEQGSGVQNEAVNFPPQITDGPTGIQNQEDSLPPTTDNTNLQAQVEHPQQSQAIPHEAPRTVDSDQSSAKSNQELQSPSQKVETDNNYRPPANSLLVNSEAEAVGHSSHVAVSNQPQSADRSSTTGNQPQNQLLKQLLGNCSSADNPPPDGNSPLLIEPNKSTLPPVSVNHGIIPKQMSGNIPTISFQMDTGTKTSGSLTVTPQTGSQIRGPTLIGANRSSLGMGNNYEIKTYNVAQQIQPTVNLNMGPSVPVRLQPAPSSINSNSILHRRAEGPTLAMTRPAADPIPRIHVNNDRTISSSTPVFPITPVQSTDGATQSEECTIVSPQTDHSIRPSPANLVSGPGFSDSASSIGSGKNPVARPPKDDYIAKRRALLEMEKTPPPQDIKPKKRVRGPNKRSRSQLDKSMDDVNPSTSDTSQQADALQGPTVKKRVRKGQNKSNKPDAENVEFMLTTLARKIHNELPVIQIKEPKIGVDNNVGTMVGSGDLNHRVPKLRGSFGSATPIPNGSVFGKGRRGKKKRVGYYHEEFSSEFYDSRIELNGSRMLGIENLPYGCESPTSIISDSSSDLENELDFHESGSGVINDPVTDLHLSNIYTPNIDSFLSDHKRISSKENPVDLKDVNNNARPKTPSIPILVNLPTTHPSSDALRCLDQELDENDKENRCKTADPLQTNEAPTSLTTDSIGNLLNMRLKDHGNVSVTLTLTNKETDGVKRVLNSLSQLIDYPIPASCVMSNLNGSSVSPDEKPNLSNSFQLITEASMSQLGMYSGDHKNLKFNEKSYVSLARTRDEGSTARPMAVADRDIDIKPEFCCRCKAIVVDRGIRKKISEIPDTTIVTMRKLSIVEECQTGELVFCSVHCYADSIMNSKEQASNQVDRKVPAFRAPSKDLPPMSPMMEDDEEENLKTMDDQDRAKLGQRLSIANASLDQGSKRKWADVRYTRWTPSYFELNNKSINQASIEESMDVSFSDGNPPSSTHLTNHNDSSIDSNDSDDNSISYGQPMSMRTSGSIEESYSNQDVSLREELQTNPSKKFRSSQIQSQCKDMIIPRWPENMDLIQVRPIRARRKLKIRLKSDDIDGDQEDFVESQDEEVVEELFDDKRKCVLCHEYGDGESDGPARLLNLFVDSWVHLNCALWSLDVYELGNGALMNVELACRKAMICTLCHRPGATLKCFKPRCPNYYHFLCAIRERCSFYEDKSVQCRQHSKSLAKEMTTFIVRRRVYVNRDEQKQIAEMIQSEQMNVIRIGSLVFLSIGQLLPHQLASFHDQNNIFPVGYKVIRYYWSYRQFNKRCKYLCTIEDHDGRPQFKVIVQESDFEDQTFVSDSPQLAWRPIIEKIVNLRKQAPDTITTFPAYIRGVDLFGLNEPSIIRILESLPGVESLTDYDFKFGRSPLLELPLAVNPSGCARTEPKLRTHLKRPYTIQSANSLPKSRLQSLSSGELSSPYIKQFVHSKSSQYRKMKSEWRNNVVLARSRVQGLGLYAARDIEKHTMVIEYIGMLIRNEIAEKYEKIHEAHNRGIYMFRLDEDRVIDATLAGGLARYINHSCNPNCVAEAVEIDRERKILIIANRRILKGEELAYDYKLAIEDDQHKISCLCGAPTCKKWMN